MNEFQIGAHPYGNGYIAWFRKVHKTENEIIKGKGGEPIIFPTKDAAKAAAGEAMVAYINGSLVRDGVKAERYAAADNLFKQKGMHRTPPTKGARNA